MFMTKELIYGKHGDQKKQRETTCQWIGVNANSWNIDVSAFMKDDGTIDADAIFEMVKNDLLLRHKNELRRPCESRCI